VNISHSDGAEQKNMLLLSSNIHKPVVSKTSEAGIWLRSYDYLTDVGGQRGGAI